MCQCATSVSPPTEKFLHFKPRRCDERISAHVTGSVEPSLAAGITDNIIHDMTITHCGFRLLWWLMINACNHLFKEVWTPPPPPASDVCTALSYFRWGAKRDKNTSILFHLYTETQTQCISVLYIPFLPSMKLISEALYGSYSSLPFLSIAQIAKGTRHFPCSTTL
jgi:hypothetical protein